VGLSRYDSLHRVIAALVEEAEALLHSINNLANSNIC
jgi:hypothetical protein